MGKDLGTQRAWHEEGTQLQFNGKRIPALIFSTNAVLHAPFNMMGGADLVEGIDEWRIVV